jgi:hypothetical protein
MLSEKERLFVDYWKIHRLREKNIVFQFLTGLPVGLIFALPVLLILFTGRFWYKRADMVANSDSGLSTLIIAIIVIAAFVAVFYKRHQWEMKDQQYRELIRKDEKTDKPE